MALLDVGHLVLAGLLHELVEVHPALVQVLLKQSGYGRDNGLEALDGFLQTKTVWVELSGATRDPFVIG